MSSSTCRVLCLRNIVPCTCVSDSGCGLLVSFGWIFNEVARLLVRWTSSYGVGLTSWPERRILFVVTRGYTRIWDGEISALSSSRWVVIVRPFEGV